MRIVVAMSGGVDSSVAAALLAADGHDVIGLSMQLYDQTRGDVRFGSCCTIDDLYDARRVAASLGIPHYIVNLERQFGEHVLSNFIDEYASGRTPIPCVHCNGDLKFAELADRARGFGAVAVATGHYARVERDSSGRYRLLRGVDASKDQSYFLFILSQDQLAHAQFPVGALTKDDVRAAARRFELRVAEKPDSQELCFAPSGEHASFVDENLPEPVGAGVITDRDGHVLGRHEGTHRFTIGQRKGLGLSAGVPLYVVAIDAADRRVVVGPREALDRTTLTASQVNWISGEIPSAPVRALARIRYRHHEAPATITWLDADKARVVFDEPQTAITPGQAVVFYDGDEVLGGGWID
ncbi:MAG TPA: tRNA 2-thiouridine(34) synthase MnmA [Vicinamibacterales bacterium]|jgi:tRNA-specific 2-thiouridylase|nr:tRNA 2-thiouridine(34) synthase MnmA [Vicinamibacterales bacterium]